MRCKSWFDEFHHSGFFYGVAERWSESGMNPESRLNNESRRLLEERKFTFRCHDGVSCYLTCCSKVELRLYPYDVQCLKNNLACTSAEFLEKYTRMGTGAHSGIFF